jgi:tetratricopeptide (TPR) repeat protein
LCIDRKKRPSGSAVYPGDVRNSVTMPRPHAIASGRPSKSAKHGGRNARQQWWRRPALIVFGFALLVRLVYVIDSSDNPTFLAPIVDSADYDRLARSFVETGSMEKGFFWQQFFYPFWLSGVYRCSGSSIVAAKILQASLGALTCLLTYRLGQRIFDRRTGLLAAGMTALYGPLIFHETELVAAGWAAFWCVALTLLFLRVRDGKRSGLWFLLGICGALSIVTRPNFFPFFATGCLWLVVRWYQQRREHAALAARLALVLAGSLLIALPIAETNRRVTGYFSILPKTGGLNFYMGNNPNADQTVALRPGVKWERFKEMPLRAGAAGSPAQEQRFFYRKALEYVLGQPGAFLSGLGAKALQFVNAREMPGNIDVYLYRDWSGLLSLLVWRAGGFGFPFAVLFPLAVLGLVEYRRRLPGPVWFLLLLYPASLILIHVQSRHRVPVVPVMAIVAAAGCLSLIRTVQSRRWRHAGLAAGGAFGLTLLSVLPGPFFQERVDLRAEIYFGVGCFYDRSGDVDKAVATYNHALRLNPKYAEAHRNLGLVFRRIDRLDEAAQHAQAALQSEPEYPAALTDMGNVLVRLGEYDQAVEYFARALQVKPDWPEALNDLASTLALQKKYEAAELRYRQVLRLDPDSFSTHGNLATVLVLQGKTDEAIEAYRRIVQRWPSNVEIHVRFGVLLRQQGRLSEAVEQFSTALRLDPTHRGAREQLEWVLQRHSRPGGP